MSAPGARSPPPGGIWRHARLQRHYRVAPEPTSLHQTTTDALADRLLDFCLCLEPERARCFGPLDSSYHLPPLPNCVGQLTNAPHSHQTGTPSIPSPALPSSRSLASLFPFCELQCLRTCIAQQVFDDDDDDVAASHVSRTHHHPNCWPHYCQCAALCCRSPPVVTSTATIFHGPPITIVQSTATTIRTTFTIVPFPPAPTPTVPPPLPPPSTVFPVPPTDSSPAPPRPIPPPVPTLPLPPSPPGPLPPLPPISLPSASIPPFPLPTLPTDSAPQPTGTSSPPPPPSPSFPFPNPDPTATIAPTVGQPSPADPTATITVTVLASPPPRTPSSSQIAASSGSAPALGPAQIIGIVAAVLVLLGIAWGMLLYARLAREQSRVVPKLRDGAGVANPSWVRLTIRDMGEVNPFGSLYRRIERSGRRVGSVESGSGETQV